MWTKITRLKYERDAERYASDLTDAEWALIEPHVPAVKRLGRPRETELRAVWDAILYIARTGVIRLLEVLLHGGSHVGGWTAKHIHHSDSA